MIYYIWFKKIDFRKNPLFETNYNVNNFIHCIWYCINTNALYIDDEEINFIKTIGKMSQSKGIPVIVILCQSFDEDRAQGMKQNIESKKLKIKDYNPSFSKGLYVK